MSDKCIGGDCLISRDKSKTIHTENLLKDKDLFKNIQYAIDGGYCDGYNTVLQAYENLFGLDENYWKLVNYLNEMNC